MSMNLSLQKAKLFLSILFVFWCGATFGQIIKVDTLTKWRKSFKAGFNLNQATFSSNWKAGGINSVGFTAFLNYKANYKGERNSWDNEIDVIFGMINNQGQGYRKTLDRIFIDTKYGHALNPKLDFALSANFISQFSKGYKYFKNKSGGDSLQIISDMFAPAFITAAAGLEYHPSKFFKLRVSPVAPRITIVNDVARFVTTDNPKPYAISPGNTVRVEWLAAQLLTEFDKDIFKNVNLKCRYILFANYEELAIDRLYHRMDMNVTAKVGRFFNLNLGAILLYDHNQDTDAQLSQSFSLGALYTFQNFQDKK